MMRAASENSPIQPESEGSEEQPWKGRCSFGCYHARGKKKKCKCRCSGKLHGEGHKKEDANLERF